jgi:hypothetical protein
MDLFYKIDNHWNFIYDWALKSIQDDKHVLI